MIIKTLFYQLSRRLCKGSQLQDNKKKLKEEMTNLDKNTEG